MQDQKEPTDALGMAAKKEAVIEEGAKRIAAAAAGEADDPLLEQFWQLVRGSASVPDDVTKPYWRHANEPLAAESVPAATMPTVNLLPAEVSDWTQRMEELSLRKQETLRVYNLKAFEVEYPYFLELDLSQYLQKPTGRIGQLVSDAARGTRLTANFVSTMVQRVFGKPGSTETKAGQ